MRRIRPGLWKATGASPTPGAIKAATIFSWMETYSPIADKSGAPGPLIFNDAQMHLARIVAEDMAADRPVWLLIVKSRQMGISLWTERFLLANAILSEANGLAFRSALVAHDDDTAALVMGYYRSAYFSLPAAFDERALPLVHKALGQHTWVGGSEHRTYSIKTGGTVGFGGRLNAIHYTEAGNYADKGIDAQGAYQAIQGCLYKPGSIVIMESTANGRDPFFWRMVEDARKGQSDYRLVFLPWFLESTYTRDWRTYRKQELAARRADPGYELQPTEEEQNLRLAVSRPVPEAQRDFAWQHSITQNQLAWRRWMCRNDCGNSLERTRRFYPTTLAEAFATSEAGRWSASEIARFAAMVRDPASRGNALLDEHGAVSWRPDPVGFTRMWEPALPGETYVLCADVAEGRGADFSAAYVLKKATLTVVAALHCQAPWEMVAVALQALGIYYNTALLAVDNKPGSIADWLCTANYPRLYFHYNEARWRPGNPNVPGFTISTQTRPLILDALDRAIREERLVCPDPGFVQEMGSFVWIEREGKHAAAWNANDDRILAMAIGTYLCQGSGSKRVDELSPGGSADPAERMLHELRRFARACGYTSGEVPSL